MPRRLTPLQLKEESSVTTPGSGYTAVGALTTGPALRQSGGVSHRLYDVSTGRIASNLTNTTTTLADMTGLALPVLAGGHYYYEFTGTYASSSTACFPAMGINGPSTGASGVAANVHMHVGVGDDWWDNGCLTSFGTSRTTGFVNAANAVTIWRIVGYCHIGVTGGTIVPQFARNSGAGTITVHANSWGWVWRLA